MHVPGPLSRWLSRRRGTHGFASLIPALIACVWFVYGLAGLHAHGTTSDEPSLYYAGDRTLFWLLHPRAPHALDFAGPEPEGFTTEYKRFPTWDDPMHYPVFPSVVAAVSSAIFHDALGWLDVVDGHHFGLVALNALALWLFGRWAIRLLGPTAGIAATVALALYPSGVGHAFNNPKDWPSAMFSGQALLAAGAGAVENRGRPMLWAALYLGLSLSCKLNGVFTLAAIAVWVPIAYLLLFRRRGQTPTPGAVGGVAIIPYISGATFVLLWPWLTTGKGLAACWQRLGEYVGFMLSYGMNQRTWWTIYPGRAVFFMTPPVVLLAVVVALVRLRRATAERKAIATLMLIAGGLPLLRAAAPGSNFYDANRHFLEYVPPLCVLAGIGAAEIAAWLPTVLPRLRARVPALARVQHRIPAALAAVALLALVWPLAAYRPYETTYFNAFIGGLGGAQRQALFYLPAYESLTNGANGTEGDYWWSATRDGIEAAHALDPSAPIALCGSSVELLPQALRKPDSGLHFVNRGQRDALVFVSPREGSLFCGWTIVRELESRRPVLKRVERGGGLVWEILGPETGKTYTPPTPENRYTAIAARAER